MSKDEVDVCRDLKARVADVVPGKSWKSVEESLLVYHYPCKECGPNSGCEQVRR